MKRGFTFPELIVVVGIVTLLSGLGAAGMLGWRNRMDLAATRETILTDTLSQQMRAMTGACYNTGNCGVYFTATGYTLFDGSTYDPASSANFPVPLEDNFQFSTINVPGTQIVFQKNSGEIAGYDPNQSQIVLTETNSGRTVTFHWNKYGVELSP